MLPLSNSRFYHVPLFFKLKTKLFHQKILSCVLTFFNHFIDIYYVYSFWAFSLLWLQVSFLFHVTRIPWTCFVFPCTQFLSYYDQNKDFCWEYSLFQQSLGQSRSNLWRVEQFSCLYWGNRCFGCKKFRLEKCVLPKTTRSWRVIISFQSVLCDMSWFKSFLYLLIFILYE